MSPSLRPEESVQIVAGQRLDRYELLCPIGLGGMAAVWVARLVGKHGFEKLVAVKTILPRFASDPKFLGMFLDEARIASRIQHMNVAQILDLGDQNGVVYLAMEWIEGEALSKIARSVHGKGLQFPPGIALRILADVCAGLHAAHELRDRRGEPLDIVHRDVSPHNILISDQGIVKVIDFGIAKARDRVESETETGSFKGKIRYVAPEQALSPRTVDRRVDIWAVGAILYYLLAGRSPYYRDNDMATLTHLASGRPPLPLPANVPKEVRAVTTRALAWHAKDRPATAAQLGRALEQALADMKITVTSTDVAAFCKEHLAARMDERRAAIEAALSAADERARSRSGPVPSAGSIASSNEVRSNEPQSSRRDSIPPIPEKPPSNPSGITSPTLGAAGTMTSSPAITTGSGRQWRMAAALATLAAAVVGAVTLDHGKDEPRSEAKVAAPPAATMAAASAAVPPVEPTVAPSASVPPTPSPPSASASAARPPPVVPVARPLVTPRAPPPRVVPKPRPQYGF